MAATTAPSRRRFLQTAALAVGAAAAGRRLPAAEPAWPDQLYATEDTTHGKRSLFDGRTLAGWRAIPRLDPTPVIKEGMVPLAEVAKRTEAYYAARPDGAAVLAHRGQWRVEEGAITGGQLPAGCGLGAYLQTEETFQDFELEFEARHDWPVDSGVLLRQHAIGALGYQVSVEPRPRGNMGGFFVNGIGNFRSAPFYLDALELPGFRYSHLTQGVHDGKPFWPLDYAGHFEDFARVWQPDGWNRFRVRCRGVVPVVTSWINGVEIASLDYASVHSPGFDPARAAHYLGGPGHIGFEVHDSPPGGMGRNRWAPGAICRWRNITIQPL